MSRASAVPVVALHLPAGRELRLRAFGAAAADLSVDFTRTAEPTLITDILACCADLDAAALHELPVSTRLECLLALAGMEVAELEVALRCPAGACGEAIEVSFTVAELLELSASAPVEDPVAVDAAGVRLLVRRPTGADQDAWLGNVYGTQSEAERAVARTLVRADDSIELTPEQLAAIDAVLEALDPLTVLTVAAACPCCGATGVHDVDVAALTLARLAAVQRRTIEEVHVLARRYHWNESEVLAVPPRRRARYLALLERESR